MDTSTSQSARSLLPVFEIALQREAAEALHFALKQSAQRWRSDDPSQHESAPPYRQKLIVERMERELYDALKAWEK